MAGMSETLHLDEVYIRPSWLYLDIEATDERVQTSDTPSGPSCLVQPVAGKPLGKGQGWRALQRVVGLDDPAELPQQILLTPSLVSLETAGSVRPVTY